MALEVRTIIAGIGDTATITQTVSASKSTDIVETIAGEATDTQVACACNVSAAKAVVMFASGALTVKTNSSSNPQETITLAANQVLVWINGTPGAVSPFANDVTTIFATNAAQTAVTLTIKIVEDATE